MLPPSLNAMHPRGNTKRPTLKQHLAKFLADVLPPAPVPPAPPVPPPPIIFEFAGLQKQLSDLNDHLTELVRIEQKRERHEIASRGF